MEKKVIAGFLLLGLLSATLSTQRAAAAAPFSPAVYVFGDSLADVGNNNFLPGSPQANFLPYGIDFPDRVPTGRFTNGLIGVDFIARAAAGLRKSPPSFLSLTHANKQQLKQMLRGVNFASAGAGILDTTGKHVVTMAEQIKDFEGVVANLTAKAGKEFASASLKKSLVFISVGSNDLFGLYKLIAPGNSTQKDGIVPFVLGKFKEQLQAIYDHGGRKFAILGTARIGCVPGMRVLMPSGGCNEDLNDLSLRFRAAVKALLEELSATLDGFKYSYTDLNEINNDIAADPHKYGLTELQAACCGSGILNAEGPCTPNATYCGDRSRYFFWDGTHPTETVYRAVAQLSLYGRPPFVYPVNIHRLLKS